MASNVAVHVSMPAGKRSRAKWCFAAGSQFWLNILAVVQMSAGSLMVGYVHDFRTVFLFFVRRRWVLGEVPAFRGLGCEVCLPVVITPRIAAVLDAGRARRRGLRLDLRSGGLFRRGAGVRYRRAWPSGRLFLRRYARAFDDFGADLREGSASAPACFP
jgi:hypothetical protein